MPNTEKGNRRARFVPKAHPWHQEDMVLTERHVRCMGSAEAKPMAEPGMYKGAGQEPLMQQ